MELVCNLSVVPVRKSPRDSAEQVTQLLYGENVNVTNEEGCFYKIHTKYDNYEGWVDKKQLSPLKANLKNEYIVNQPIVNFDNKILVAGSLLSKDNIEKETFERLLNLNQISKLNKKVSIKELIINAKKYLNAPYQWGGKSPFGIDCSGFTQVVFRLSGIKIQRDAYQQATEGKTISNFKDLKTGDLAFFNKKKSKKITHVGIVIKDGNTTEIIHASSYVQINKLTSEGIIDSKKLLSHQYLFSKRII